MSVTVAIPKKSVDQRAPNGPLLVLRRASRLGLLAGTSALALLLATPQIVQARQPGMTAGTIPGMTSDAAVAAAQNAESIARNAQNSLARASQAIQAMQAAQAAARALAASGPSNLRAGLPAVTDGLSPGGLVVDPRVATDPALWQNANAPVQSSGGGQTNVTITQTAQNAVLTWQQFNIGKNTTLTYDQGGNQSWIALNRIDASGLPSQILGRIKADGTVLLINPNGIIFGGSSQINVHTLIATALDIDSNAASTVFAKSSAYVSFTANGVTLFAPPNEDTADNAFVLNGLMSNPAGLTAGASSIFSLGNQSIGSIGGGAIVVQPGAMINTSGNLSPTGDGGFVALFGTSVTNQGTIATQNGQIILGAAPQIVLSEPASGAVGTQTALTATDKSSGTFAGSTIVVPVLNGTGVVRNDVSGLLQSGDGAVTLLGDSIRQSGLIAATTSASRPASILMTTVGSASAADGNIVFGPASVTMILPDESSSTLPTGTANSTITTNGVTAGYFSTVVQPQINILATGNVDLQGNGASGAWIKAPGAALTAAAGGTLLLEGGSNIDLSGLIVTLPMSSNQISILITAAEVGDDPLAQSLIAQTVTIDARLSGTRADGFQWVGSPILDVAGYVNLVPERIDQLLTVGGSFNVSTNNFIQLPGAGVNVSGGYVAYQGGMIDTTRVIGANGRIYNIGSADPSIAYVGILGNFTVDHSHWGVTDVWNSPMLSGGRFEPGYIAGISAGLIGITAVNPILEGDIVAEITDGDRQRAMAGSSNLSTYDKLPSGGTLNITFGGVENGNPNRVVLESQAAAGADPFGLNSGRFSLATAATWTPTLVNGAFPVFTDLLTADSLGTLSIKGANQLSMPNGAVLSVLPVGSITFDGVTTIDGTLNAPSGKISLTGFTYPAPLPQLPPTPALVIGPDAVLNVRGQWVNDTGLLQDQLEGRAFVNGGSVSIATIAASSSTDGTTNFTDVTQSIILDPGSVIDVSGGGYVDTTGKLKTGADGLPVGQGGSLSLTTYKGGFGGVPAGNGAGSAQFNVSPRGHAADGSVNLANNANVLLDGTIFAGGFDGGGTFTLQAPTIEIESGATLASFFAPKIVANGNGALGRQSGLAMSAFAISNANAGTIVLPAALLADSGFSQFSLTSTFGDSTVRSGTRIVLQQPTFLSFAGIQHIATGAVVRHFAPTGVLPAGLQKPVSLTLGATSIGTNLVAPRITIEQGASIVAEPTANVSLTGASTTTVLGDITAPGGSIDIIAPTTIASLAPTTIPGTVIIGPSAVLDVSGTFVPNPLVTAFSTGTVINAGTIALSGTIVVQPGAQLDLAGAAASAASDLIQLQQGGSIGGRLVGQAAWSNGGNLLLDGLNIYFAGSVDAAGGAALASGGTLTIGSNIAASVLVIEPAGVIAANLPAQGGAPSTPGAFIGADTLSNGGFDSVSMTAGSIAFGGSINVTLPGSLTLNSTNGQFLLLPQSAALEPMTGVTLDGSTINYALPSCGPAGSCIATIGRTVVNLNAGYVRLAGATGLNFGFHFPHLADGSFNINAQWIDLEQSVRLDNAGDVKFTSTEAIRLLPNDFGTSVTTNQTVYGGALVVPGELALKAAEIFPGSNTDFLLMSTGTLDKHNTITIQPNGPATVPLSVGGTLLLSAENIEQDGVLWAPLGGIVLGMQKVSQIPSVTTAGFDSSLLSSAFVPTQGVILGAGSLTTVSAAGQDIPFGSTLNGSAWNSDSERTTVLATPPSKSIGIFGASVTTNPGAVVDLSGGGDVFATEFVPGNGGSRNVLTAPIANGNQVYALVPSYEAKVAAFDSSFNVSAGTVITPGMSVTIGPGSSIPAGTYTLLPGMYATLPGAYRVVQTASNVNPNVVKGGAAADGSQYVVGQLSNSLTGARSSQSALFEIQSDAVWSKYSQVTITSGTSFFRNQALAAGTTPPPLPIDGGVLTFGATTKLDLGATNLFAPGNSDLAPGLMGAGGQVQISATNILIRSSDLAIPAGDCIANCGNAPQYLVLDADQISHLGAASVLIGGTAVFGTDANNASVDVVTAAALNLEVETDAAHPLTGPELMLVSLAKTPGVTTGNGLVVDAGSVIQAIGSVPDGTDRNLVIGAVAGATPAVSGDGALLRVSNGGMIDIVRLDVPASAAQGSFSIGAGARIESGNSLMLDTSANGSFADGVALKALNYLLSANVINLGGGTSGLVLESATLADFAGAQSVTLRSGTIINLFDRANPLVIGNTSNPIGALILDSAGLYSQGGTTIINATNIDLADTRGSGTGLPSGGGTLTLNASADIIEDVGTKSLGGFSDIKFSAGQAIIFNGNGSLDGGPAATAIAALGVANISVVSGGSGYTGGAAVTVTGPGGTQFSGTAVVDSNGTITGVNITSAGSGFTGPITAISVAGPGSGANLAASLGVVGITVTAGGDSYATSPTVVISGGGGSGATATAAVAGDVVTGSSVTAAGLGFVSIPTISFVGGANFTLSAPEILVNGGATQSLASGNRIQLITGAGTAPAIVPGNIGGTLALLAASIDDTAKIQALSGKISMTATAGNVMLEAGALVDASGSSVTVLDVTQDAPGGTVQLMSNTGDVTIDPDARVSVASSGRGYAGSLSILAANKVAFGGTLDGHAAFKDLGGNFSLWANTKTGALPLGGGFSSTFSVQLGSGDIGIDAGQTLSSGRVLLVTNNGAVRVDGTIDASGPSGGSISLYGGGKTTNGVTSGDGVSIGAGAVLNASYQFDDPSDPAYGNGTSTLVQKGGTITLGSAGAASTTLNTQHGGYEDVASSSGITVVDGAIFNVSGGPGGTNIDNTGGSVIIRAPILTTTDPTTNDNVNVSFKGTVITNADHSGNPSGAGVVLNAYAVWSTTDGCSLIPGGCGAVTTVAQYNALNAAQQAQLQQHFDGVIDPAGFFDATLTNNSPTQIIFPTGGLNPLSSPSVPAAGAFIPHVDFYQGTLKDFVNAPFDATLVSKDFFGAKLQIGASAPVALPSSMLHLRPEIDLVNPSPSINNGNITVTSNWNLGAATDDGSGTITLAYRTNVLHEPGVLSLMALNNVNIDASISDGFFVDYTPPPPAVSASALYASETNSPLYLSYLGMFSNGVLQYNSSGIGNLLGATNKSWARQPISSASPSFSFFGLSTPAAYAALNLQFTLAMPTVTSGDPNVVDQYNQYYTEYVALFRAYEQELIAVNKNGVNPSKGATVQGGIVLSYADFLNFVADKPTGVSTTLVLNPSAFAIPAAPTTSTAYFNGSVGTITFALATGLATTTATDYVTKWVAYLYNVIDVGLVDTQSGSGLTNRINNLLKPPTLTTAPGADFTKGILAAIAVTPPAPPPPYGATLPGFVSSSDTAPPIDRIANNPAQFGSAVFNTTSASQLMSQAVSGAGSFSYNLVAGAAFNGNMLSADPTAAVPLLWLPPTVTGDVTVNGHTSYADTLISGRTINIPTLVRTGTGSITIAAAANVEFLDQTAPGAIYTAGVATTLPPDFIAPTLPATYTINPNGLVGQPAWGVGGGAISVTVGGSIIGIEMPIDTNGSQTGVSGAGTGQLWSDWYDHYGVGQTGQAPLCGGSCQTASWVNYATFFQGFGALGGGNITLSAGADIIDIGASLPETIIVSGRSTATDPAKVNYYGGGNLRVTAGGNLESSDFLVGRGTGLIQVGGTVQATTSNPVNQGKATQDFDQSSGGLYALPLLLAVQDGFTTVNARGSITLGNVFDPASLPLDAAVLTPIGDLPGAAGNQNFLWSNFFTSFGSGSGVSLTSVSGDVAAITVSSSAGGLFVHNGSNTASSSVRSSDSGSLLPATLEIAALSGDITVNKTAVSNNNLFSAQTQAGDDTGALSLIAAGSIDLGAGLTMDDASRGISPSGTPQPNLVLALHTNDSNPVLVVAGTDIDANGTSASSSVTFSLNKPAKIEAGNNINAPGLVFSGQNNNADDITSIVAGNDFVGGTYMLYGPGTLLLQAGRNMGPFSGSSFSVGAGAKTNGIMSVGNGSALGSSALRPYLPAQGAEVDVLYGVKPGIDYAAAIASFVDPSQAGQGGIDLLASIAAILGQSRDQAWDTFEALPQARQQFLFNRVFLDFLAQVGKDAKNSASPFFGQYTRAYDVISTLFPARLGYTDNRPTGGNGAAATISTGKLNIISSVLETQMGGDINIVGPGGGIAVGANAQDNLKPNQEGILTLAGGTIRAYTDGSILVNQSRIMTQQGGDIDLFTANGDIFAGEGPKTFISSPVISDLCLVTGYCYVNPQGLVTGAGIAALQTLPGQDPSKSNVTLVAPHGTIDVGSAGLRGTNITLAALTVLNAYNIQATGTVTGLTITPPPNVAALSSASNATVATQQTGLPTPAGNNDRPSVIIVEVLGYGGGDGDNAPDDKSSKKDQRSENALPAYDPTRPVKILGVGPLTEEEKQSLNEDEKSKL